MRTYSIAVFFIIAGLAISCSKSDSNENVNTVISQGNWIVHLYTKNGTNETSSYSGYVFTFAQGGTMTVVKGATTYTGTWAVVQDSGKTKLVITWTSIGLPSALSEIDEDWLLVSSSDTLIELEDGNSSKDVDLHFHRQ